MFSENKMTRSLHHIPENSQEIKDEIEQKSTEAAKYKKTIFGADDLENFDRYSDALQRKKEGDTTVDLSEESLQESIDQHIKNFERNRALLSRYAENKNEENQYLLKILYKEFQGSQYFEEHGEEVSQYFSIEDDKVEFNQEMPIDLVIILLRAHVENYTKLEKEAQERFEKYKEEYIQKVSELIDAGYDFISKDVLRERVNTIPMILNDTFMYSPDIAGLHGGFMVEIRPGFDPEEEKHIVFHELTHAISGQIFIKKETEFDITEFGAEEKHIAKYPNIYNRKIGLALYVSDKDLKGEKRKNAGEKFRFLNEAVTEFFTKELLGLADDETTYKKEVLELELLIDFGISKRLIYEAYFENPEIDDSGKHRVIRAPKFTELIKKINKQEGRNWLMETDKRLK